MRFWGVRGSIPSPGPATKRYGGNTPCVEVRCGDELLIFDLGSGARGLGDALVATRKPVKASIFISHYHYDHLQGLPFFSPMFSPANDVTLYGSPRDGKSLKQILAGQMVHPYFPVTAEEVFRTRLAYRDVVVGEDIPVGKATVRTLELNHPGGNVGYRVDFGGRSLVYATDVEHGTDLDAKLFDFARGADALIYDSMYTEDEYRGRNGPARTGWGHSTWEAAVRAADASEVKQLVLFHHDPGRDDAGMDKLLREVRKHRKATIAAKEAMVIQL
ncbi:MBL fold metallo-hydrolase [Corallococcus exiguus]|uniref:MBL fold metallo-hydrolase n=1 Tax=Corallococcus TaxID=83461 RepID=UPI000EC6F329|nr:MULTISPECIES: MBL fold metallo-hydrolase [unclassified Corallococcus]MBN9684893.1 MBL fold metallo-hydrolase [Corallococcus sp. NCSPR001]NNB88690.1 MBL fold metallo-hydrolase [Corallococcus exiguus]NNB96332.1 MBL fold metallo-hydrolase [Corallococcus exiguus]NNC05126.1 MBL fold metallo-hydrolase [Corallococcus exiguus]NPC51603.1 MBL fold metallo-hydrolase [Corallococcus exiguus]